MDGGAWKRPRVLLVATVLFAVALLGAGKAEAGGGNYVFDGGSADGRAQVRDALEASTFDWGLVPARITIHIGPGRDSYSTPGEIWLDANLLAAGRFSWGVVQHEYAHQVDFFLLGDADRRMLNVALGGKDWCYGVPGLRHADYGCERFASTLSWAYWTSADNSLKPESASDESAAMAPEAFRALVARLLAGSPSSSARVDSPPPVRAAAPLVRPHRRSRRP